MFIQITYNAKLLMDKQETLKPYGDVCSLITQAFLSNYHGTTTSP